MKVYLEKMTTNFPGLLKDIGTQGQEEQAVPNMMNLKRPTPRHSITKMSTVKVKRILKAATEKQLVTYNGVL